VYSAWNYDNAECQVDDKARDPLFRLRGIMDRHWDRDNVCTVVLTLKGLILRSNYSTVYLSGVVSDEIKS
jgi:hypothetical protein